MEIWFSVKLFFLMFGFVGLVVLTAGLVTALLVENLAFLFHYWKAVKSGSTQDLDYLFM